MCLQLLVQLINFSLLLVHEFLQLSELTLCCLLGGSDLLSGLVGNDLVNGLVGIELLDVFLFQFFDLLDVLLF